MARYVLLVEGRDDQVVIGQLIKYHKLAQPLQDEAINSVNRRNKIDTYQITSTNENQEERFLEIRDKQGIKRLTGTLDVQFDESDLEVLGIVVDADNDLMARWQSLLGVLRVRGYTNLPVAPDPDGTIITQTDLPTVGIWLMPDNKLPGMLEDFVSFLVPDRANEPRWHLAERCVQEVLLIAPELPQTKAHIHTWLAWQDDPGTPLGLAITKRYLQAEATHARQLVGWLERLFNSLPS